MFTFLHAGCGWAEKKNTTKLFASENWKEIRLDIDEGVKPDIVSSITNMPDVPTESVDAIYTSHTIEHLYAHEVALALKEFLRVLKPKGHLVLTCPDIQKICALVAEDKLLETAYVSPAGPITPFDVLFGFRKQIAQGNLFMAHKSGFTKKVLYHTLLGAGFSAAVVARREQPFFDLWAVAVKSPTGEDEFNKLFALHFHE